MTVHFSRYRTPNVEGLNHLRTLDSIWFPVATYTYANRGDIRTIGIVKVYDTQMEETRFYIGCGKGKSLQFDEDLIVSGGSKYYHDELAFFFKKYGEE